MMIRWVQNDMIHKQKDRDGADEMTSGVDSRDKVMHIKSGNMRRIWAGSEKRPTDTAVNLQAL